MKLSSFAAYIKQLWRNKPDTSTPVSAERLIHMEDGIKGNSNAIEEIAAAVVSQIVNDPDKIASMAALFAVNQKVATLDGKVGDTAQLPAGSTDTVGAITKLYSDLATARKDITGITLGTEGHIPQKATALVDYANLDSLVIAVENNNFYIRNTSGAIWAVSMIKVSG